MSLLRGHARAVSIWEREPQVGVADQGGEPRFTCHYSVSTRTSTNFRKSSSNVATGMSMATPVGGNHTVHKVRPCLPVAVQCVEVNRHLLNLDAGA